MVKDSVNKKVNPVSKYMYLVLTSISLIISGCGSQAVSPEIEERNRKWEEFYNSYKAQHPSATEGEVLCETNKEFGDLRSCPGSASVEDMYDQLEQQMP